MTAKLISSIKIEGLFGLYNYSIPNTGILENAAILYGDNGVGKSTLLRLAFHLLSPANDRGHRSALHRTEFKYLEVRLSSGLLFTAKKIQVVENEIYILLLEIWDGSKRLAVWDHMPDEHRRSNEKDSYFFEVTIDGRKVVRREKHHKKNYVDIDFGDTPRGNMAYLNVLSKLSPTIFILNADRRLDSDSVADPDDEIELRRTMQYGEPRRVNELVARSREIALSQALASAWRWLSRKAVQGTNQGSVNVHSVYGDVLRRLVSSGAEDGENSSDISITELSQQLAKIDEKSSEHEKYELATHLSTKDFKKSISGRSKSRNQLAARLLKPYLTSVEGRLTAVEPLYQLIDRFVKLVNELLTDKSITFKLSQGFSLKNRLNVPLDAAKLSSGEQQLLLLFCYVLTARDKPTVFMIDEPEISLNIKWQRRLIQVLLDITEGAPIQFIFASHSMELLSQHRSRVVKLAGVQNV
ncbi:MAG: AAA family ATPase [Comamonas sp.]|nr:AAA family ATPase [Comamonas sp.]